jgi:hypothetical protein
MIATNDPHRPRLWERPDIWIASAITASITLVSTVGMVRQTSTELSWDEADYALALSRGWGILWRSTDFSSHFHGPLFLYLAKIGSSLLPGSISPIELRLRLPEALMGSLAIGLLYPILKYWLRTSSAAALAGSALLLFSVIRLQETNIIGPHHLILLWTLILLGFGFRFRHTVNIRTSILLGLILGSAFLTMSYTVPLAVCWAVSAIVAGSDWFPWKFSKPIEVLRRATQWLVIVFAVAAIVVLFLWPPGILNRQLWHNFAYYLHYGDFPIWFNGAWVARAPRIAYGYWLATIDAPILLCSMASLGLLLWRIRRIRFDARQIYVTAWIVVLTGTTLAAHIAGPRNLLLTIGVLCVGIAVTLDGCISNSSLKGTIATAVIALSAGNMLRASMNQQYTPQIATEGYRRFVAEHRDLLSERAAAVVSGDPILRFYAREAKASIEWQITQLPRLPQPNTPWPPDTKYALIFEPAYLYMSSDQPVRRIIIDNWKLVWSLKQSRSWGLRFYERP